MMMKDRNFWLDGMMGLIVGDALGVPVQFMSRDSIKNRPEGPVTGMESGGVYNMPAGTWSDDSSMALATLQSLINRKEADPLDIMKQFVRWEIKGEYTPFGKAFDQGNTCVKAIERFINERNIKTCGVDGKYANGNGALMRILPVCLHCRKKQIEDGITDDEAIRMIHEISGLTHNHLRSKMCCGIYYFCVKVIVESLRKDEEVEGEIFSKDELINLLQAGVDNGLRYYGQDRTNLNELAYLGRLFDLKALAVEKEDNIFSSAYVIDTIEAAFWCLITTDSYKDCVLKAVNLGKDTDTVAAIAGGLAGLYYGYENIPDEWLGVIKRRRWIEEMCCQVQGELKMMNVPLVDTHIHCIYGVDDGAQSLDMSMEMIRELYNQGTRYIVCTPHNTAYDTSSEEVIEHFNELKTKCANEMEGLNLYLGCEIYVAPESLDLVLDYLAKGKYISMNKTKYILTEFPTKGIDFSQVKYCIEKLQQSGWKPIIAHAERYSNIIKCIEDIRKLKKMGCLIQINAYSLLEEAYVVRREMANKLLDEKLVDMIGSDAHRTNIRAPRMVMGAIEIYRRCDKEYADAICFKNAAYYFNCY